MSQRQALMVFGVWLAILPFLGFPLDWEKILACLSGLLVVFLAYRFNQESAAKKEDTDAVSYSEHRSAPTPAATPKISNDIPAEAPATEASTGTSAAETPITGSSDASQ